MPERLRKVDLADADRDATSGNIAVGVADSGSGDVKDVFAHLQATTTRRDALSEQALKINEWLGNQAGTYGQLDL